MTEIPECFIRRQIDEPFRVGGEAAHGFQRGRGILFSNRDRTMQPGIDDPFPKHVFHVEQIIVTLLRGELGNGRRG
jgi:hypothetical protein